MLTTQIVLCKKKFWAVREDPKGYYWDIKEKQFTLNRTLKGGALPCLLSQGLKIIRYKRVTSVRLCLVHSNEHAVAGSHFALHLQHDLESMHYLV